MYTKKIYIFIFLHYMFTAREYLIEHPSFTWSIKFHINLERAK